MIGKVDGASGSRRPGPWAMVHLWLDDSESRLIRISLARQDELLLVNPPPLPLPTLHSQVVAGVRQWRPFGSAEAPEVSELEVLRVVMALGHDGHWKRFRQPGVLAAADRDGDDVLSGLLELIAASSDDRTATLYSYPSGRRWESTLPSPDPSSFVRLADAAAGDEQDNALQWVVWLGTRLHPRLMERSAQRLIGAMSSDAITSDGHHDAFVLNATNELGAEAKTELAGRGDSARGCAGGPIVASGTQAQPNTGAASADIRRLYLASSPEDQLHLLPRASMPEDVLAQVVEGGADPALVIAALANPACPQQLLVAALRDPDATVRLEALQGLQTRQLSAPVGALRDSVRLPFRGRPSDLQEVIEFSPRLLSDLARELLGRPDERAEADARLMEVHEALRSDLLYAMSQSAQELFHSNTWAWLIKNRSPETEALLTSLGSELGATGEAKVWREHHHLDLLVDPGESHPKLVVENKLFSVPGPEQLRRYSSTPLPWSTGHGENGAENTQYVLLSLLPPSFALPSPWSHLGYDKLTEVIEHVAEQLGGTDGGLMARYAQLLRWLSDFAAAVDPRFRPDEPFYGWQPEGAAIEQGGFSGIVQKLRFSGLVQMVQERMQDVAVDFEVNMTRGVGLASFYRRVSPTRILGWQLQGDQFRIVARMQDDGMFGKGPELKDVRGRAAGVDHAGWFDFAAAERLLGPLLRPRRPGAASWLHFDPDFVYQVRTLDKAVRTDQLVGLLAEYTSSLVDNAQ